MKKFLIVVIAMVFLVLSGSNAFCATGKDYYDYGKKFLDKGDAKRAFKYFNAALKIEPRNPDYLRAVGDCYKAVGDQARANKYYAQADQLGGGSGGSFKTNEIKAEIVLFSGGTSSTGTSTFMPVFGVSYSRYLSPTFDLTGTIGYAYGGNQTAGASGNSISLSGGGILVQAKANWHFDNLMKGVFAGPNVAYMPITYTYTSESTDFFTGDIVTTTSKINMSMIMGGIQLGYTYALDNGFKFTGFVCLDIASQTMTADGGGMFGSMNMSAVGLLQFYGISAGFGF